MITDINTINTNFWQTSAGEFGTVEVDSDDINQSIALILNTVTGSDPWRPTFGSNLFNLIDSPINVAIPGIKTAIKVDVERWEPRVKVQRVDVELKGTSNLVVSVFWELVAGSLPGSTGEIQISATLAPPPIDDDSTLLAGGTLVSPIQFFQWQLSTRSYGQRLYGVNDINQSVLIILSTIPGSDPFRPTFGSDIWKYVDYPLLDAVVQMKRAIVNAIHTWEHRILRVTRIDHMFQSQPTETMPAGIIFNVGWEFVDGTLSGAELLIGFPPITDDGQTNINFLILLLENGEPLLYENNEFILLETQPGE